MIDCMIIGDSLGVGVHTQRPECVAYVKTGINSRDWNNKFLGKPLEADVTIISLGSNDGSNIKTYDELLDLRRSITTRKVFWLAPAIKDDKRAAVYRVANEYHDSIINVRNHQLTTDGVHPTTKGYKTIANQTK